MPELLTTGKCGELRAELSANHLEARTFIHLLHTAATITTSANVTTAAALQPLCITLVLGARFDANDSAELSAALDYAKEVNECAEKGEWRLIYGERNVSCEHECCDKN